MLAIVPRRLPPNRTLERIDKTQASYLVLYSDQEGGDYGQRRNAFDGRHYWAARRPLHLDRFVLAAASQPDPLDLMFSAQYQQQPVPLEGNLIRRDWFRYFAPSDLPAPIWSTTIVQSWDLAMQTGDTNEYSVCTTWPADREDVYLLHAFRGRLEYPELRRKVIALAEQARIAAAYRLRTQVPA
jgi:hypothetical protein